MRKFVGLKAKTYSYLIDYGSEDKKAKCINKTKIKQNLKIMETFQKQLSLRIK